MNDHTPAASDRDRRHERANEEAHKRDRGWFARRPERCFRVRRAIPFEDPNWGRHDGLCLPYMLVRTSPDRDIYERHSVDAKRLPDNDEAFLSRLWEQFQTKRQADGRRIEFSPEEHLAMLKPSRGED